MEMPSMLTFLNIQHSIWMQRFAWSEVKSSPSKDNQADN